MNTHRLRTLAGSLSISLLLLGGCGGPSVENVHAHGPFSLVHGPLLGLTPPGTTPQVFAPGLVSGASDEGGVVVFPGEREVYYWAVEPVEGGGPPRAAIYMTRELNGSWTPPEVASFSLEHNNMYPALHPDGSRLFFQSDRPVDPSESTFEYNIWYVDRVGEGWSEPMSIGRPINGKNHTGGPSATRDGTLYFTIMEMGGPQEIWRSQFVDGAYQEPTRLPDQVNARVQQCDSYIAPDESYLIFFALEGDGGHGSPSGLYIAYRDRDGGWSEAMSLGPLFNSGERTGSATISPAGDYVFFSQSLPSSPTGLDIFWVSSEAVEPSGGEAQPIGPRTSPWNNTN